MQVILILTQSVFQVLKRSYGNPVGCYVKTFELKKEWKNKQVFIHFEGVESAYTYMGKRQVGWLFTRQ